MTRYDKKRKTVLIAAALLVCLFLSSLPAAAFEVVILKDAEIAPYRDAIRGFKNACGCTVKELELSDSGALEKIAAARPDAVVAVGSDALGKAKAIKNVPVIYTMVMPSEAAALTMDNVSGISMDIAPETYLAVMSELFPGLKRVGVVSDPEHTGPFVEEASAVARARGIALVVKTIRNPRQAPALLNELRDKVDVLWMLPDSTFVNSGTVDYLMLFSFQNNVPVFSFAKKYVKRGAVAALTVDPYDMGVQAGELARLLSRGGKGPVRAYAREPRLVVNEKVAAKINARINRELVRNAEKVE